MQGRDPRQWPVSDASTIEQFFVEQGKHVVYFSGYGELGYEQVGLVEKVAAQVLERWAPDDIIVLTGTLLRVGGNDGIAEIYQVARELGIRTAGIHPSVAQQFAATHRVSPRCDVTYFVDDSTWGGFVRGTELSSTLRVHLAVANELVVIGGGKHAADELRAFHEHGLPVRYFAAEMNSVTTTEWCRRAGVEIPTVAVQPGTPGKPCIAVLRTPGIPAT